MPLATALDSLSDTFSFYPETAEVITAHNVLEVWKMHKLLGVYGDVDETGLACANCGTVKRQSTGEHRRQQNVGTQGFSYSPYTIPPSDNRGDTVQEDESAYGMQSPSRGSF